MVVENLIKVNTLLLSQREHLDLVKNVVLPRRQRLYGSINSKNLIRLIQDIENSINNQ